MNEFEFTNKRYLSICDLGELGVGWTMLDDDLSGLLISGRSLDSREESFAKLTSCRQQIILSLSMAL